MAVYPLVAAGLTITAQMLNDMQPEVVYATAVQSVTNSTTLQNDSELVVALLANASYVVEVVASFDVTAASNLKTQWLVPTGSTGMRQCIGATGTSGTFTSRVDCAGKFEPVRFGTNSVSILDTSGNGQPVFETGVVNVGPTAGNVRFQWGQNTAQNVALNRQTFSFMRVTRFA